MSLGVVAAVDVVHGMKSDTTGLEEQSQPFEQAC